MQRLYQRVITECQIFPQKKGSVSSIIRSYKSAVTRHAHRLGFEFAWQPRFYDHIIRNEQSLTQIHDYILTNPQKWADDRFFIQ